MDTLPTDLGAALPPDTTTTPYFSIDERLDRRTLLEVYAEVVDGARTVLAPFGLPAVLKRHCPAPLLLERLRPAFDLLLDAASEAAYAERGLTEASVAVAVHHFLEEAEDEGVREALRGMQNALEEVVTLDDMVEVTPCTPPGATAEPPRVPTPTDLTSEMQRLGSLLGAVEGSYQDSSHTPTTNDDKSGGDSGGGGGGKAPSAASSSLVAALMGGVWPASEKRRWMARLLRAVAPRGKAAALPWETGAALREVYTAPTTSKNEGESKETSEGAGDGIEGMHAQVLAPVMLAGGDPLCAALTALEGASAVATEQQEQEGEEGQGSSSGMDAFHAFAEAVEDARRLAELQADLEEAEERLQEGCEALAPLVAAGCIPGSVLAWAQVRRALYLKEAHELEGAMEAFEAAIEADPQCGAAFLGRAQINRIFSQHAERRRKLKAKRKESERRGREGESEEDEEGDSSDDSAGAAEAEILEDLERAYALDGLRSPTELQLLESALKEALRESALETLEERLGERAWVGDDGTAAAVAPDASRLPPKWLAESYFASFHDSDGGDEIRPSATTSALTPLLTHVRALRRQGQYAEAIKALGPVIREQRVVVEGGGEGGGGMGEGGDAAWLENEWGSYCYLMGDLRGAEEAFARALALDPGSINSMIKLGEVLSDLGKAEEGLVMLDQAVQRTDMSNGDALLHRGQVKLTQEDIGGAVRDLRRAVQVDDTPPPVAYACLGTALFKIDETGESAQETLAEAAEKYPGSLEILLYHGDVLAQRGDLAGAMKRFQEAAEADPACPLPFVNAARAYLSVRDYPQAERHLAKALALDPSCGASHLDIGQLHVQRGETAKAEAALGRALSQARYLPEILDALVFKRLAELQRLYHPVDVGRQGVEEGK